ncbi:MAG TPA: ABC transporter permease subunit [Anaerolineae bacterium]
MTLPASANRAALVPKAAKTSSYLSWLGVAPFFLFAILFLLLPTVNLAIGSFQDNAGNWTLQNIVDLFQPNIINSFNISLEVSAASSIGGALFGFFLAYAAISGGLPHWVRSALLTWSGVASNFAGLPLAFAFLATLGRLGLVTVLLRNLFGLNLYDTGFNILSFWGLTITYMYFQFPLMVLIMAPAIDGLKREWREASENLGASTVQYWRLIALPILFPSILGTSLLLFANAFGAVATAYQLTGSSLGIATILLYAQIQGDVLHNQNLGYAMALGMIVITGVSNGIYIWTRARSERWLR